MDKINKALQNLHTTLAESKQKLRDDYCNGIRATSTHFQEIYNNFDTLASTYIPRYQTNNGVIDTITNEIFNPNIVIECVDGKPSIIVRPDEWNSEIGYLPNRREMYTITAYILKYDNNCIDENKIIELSKNVEILNIHNYDDVDTIIKHAHSCRTNNPGVDVINISVDNYLNMYAILGNKMGIYVCLNKVPFPEFAFTTNVKYNNMYIIYYKTVYDTNIYSKNSDATTLCNASSCIPENWQEVYNYFDGIRAMIHAKVFNIDTKHMVNLEEENGKLRADLEQKQKLLDKYKSSL